MSHIISSFAIVSFFHPFSEVWKHDYENGTFSVQTPSVDADFINHLLQISVEYIFNHTGILTSVNARTNFSFQYIPPNNVSNPAEPRIVNFYPEDIIQRYT